MKRSCKSESIVGGNHGAISKVSSLESLGVDPMQLAMDTLVGKIESFAGIKKFETSTRDRIEQLSKGLKAVPRGLADPSAITTLKAIKKLSANKRYGSYSDEILQEIAPCCGKHNMATKLLKVKKDGPNKSRKFYGCSFPSDQRCGYFLWVEDNPNLVSLTIAQRAMESEADAKLTREEVWRKHALRSYGDRLQELTVDELKQEIMRCQRLRQLEANQSNSKKAMSKSSKPQLPKLPPLTRSGRKEALIARLMTEKERTLYFDSNNSTSGDLPATSCSVASSERLQSEEFIVFSSSDDDSSGDEPECRSANQVRKSDIGPIPDHPPTKKGPAGSSNQSLRKRKQMQIMMSDDSDSTSSIHNSESGAMDERWASSDEEWGEDDDIAPADSGCDVESRGGQQHGARAEHLDQIDRILRGVFGYSQFRPGQRWAIERAIEGKSSLLILPTGAGKSLCYLIPAIALPGLTIVVSPLVALMKDQLLRLPAELPGACLSGNVSAIQASEITTSILKGFIKVLFVSPERLRTSSFRTLIRMLHDDNRNSPSSPISLVCVDEAHCLSQWSYNFRPAFLRISEELRTIRPRCVLALTATAGDSVQRDITHFLGISPTDSIFNATNYRENLSFHGSFVNDEDLKRSELLKILREEIAAEKPNLDCPKLARPTPRLSQAMSIVYVWRREDTESLAEYLNASGVPSVSYHAGMDTNARAKAQQQFFRGNVRVIVATIAFGLGIDNANVRRVVHFVIPKSVENYVQETGRAGRDGRPAQCYLLASSEDMSRQLSLCNSPLLPRLSIAWFLWMLFSSSRPHSGNASDAASRGDRQEWTWKPVVALDLCRVKEVLDIPENTAETILYLLENEPFGLLDVDGIHCEVISGKFRQGPPGVGGSGNDPLLALLSEHSTCNFHKLAEAEERRREHRRLLGGDYDDDSDDGESSMDPAASNSSFFFGPRTAVAKSMQKKSDRRFGDILVSVTQLMTATGLSRADLCRQLFSLQQRGVISFSFSMPSLFLCLRPKTCQQFAQTSQREWFHHIWKVAGEIAEKLNGICQVAQKKAVEMWKVASVLVTHETKLEESFQAKFHRLLGKCLVETDSFVDNSSIAVAPDASRSSRGDILSEEDELWRLWKSTEFEFRSKLNKFAVSPEGNRSEPRRDATFAAANPTVNADEPFLRLATALLCDSRLLNVVRGVCACSDAAIAMPKTKDPYDGGKENVQVDASKLCAANFRGRMDEVVKEFVNYLSTTKRSESTSMLPQEGASPRNFAVPIILLEVRAVLCMSAAKILHGLSTTLCPLSHWGDSGYWGMLCDVEFTSLVAGLERLPEATQQSVVIIRRLRK